MNGRPLDRLAEAYDVQLCYVSEEGQRRVAPDEAAAGVLRAMGIEAGDDAAIAASLKAAPVPLAHAIAAPDDATCYMPGWLSGSRAWGVTCQLYGLRSARNHGIGDFEDLAQLAERVAENGGDFLGVNPLHALFTADPERCSPFSPSSRRFLNPLYIALDRIPGIDTPAEIDSAAGGRLRSREQVDYAGVAALKFGALRALWDRLGDDPSIWPNAARQAYETFVEAGGEPLAEFACFESLSHHMVAAGKGAGWHQWPEAYHDAHGPAVRRFAEEHKTEIRFHLWLQWIADTQLGNAAKRARKAGMRIGLYLDMAVGAAPDGSATWSDPEAVVRGANIGAPPDSFFAGGQDWGLAPIAPTALLTRDLAPYRDVLQAAMRHAGAVRLDHAMHLHRLFWIPHGMAATNGCYVLYPMADMVRAVAELSEAHRTVVIGEDLGTVPHGFREVMKAADMLSYRVLPFEWVRGAFRAAASYEPQAFLCAATHDLPPLAAWWSGEDIALFRDVGVFTGEEGGNRRDQRIHDRLALVDRLQREARRRAFAPAPPDIEDARKGRFSDAVAASVHAFLARTPSRLLGIQFEDLCGARRPVNIPGTSTEYPNWRLRAPLSIEDAPDSALWSATIGAVKRERKRDG